MQAAIPGPTVGELRTGRLADLAPEPDLQPAPPWVCWYHQENGVWPVPDDRDADLNAEHRPVTAWVDELGAAVRERLGEIRDAACVIGHGDWHGGNVKFLDGRPLAVYDWDSVLYEPEVVIAGQAAATYQSARPEAESRMRLAGI
jgi:Ser/Thr protein kinase RdoA (MazF antagonist)